jgi:hypothetical protein
MKRHSLLAAIIVAALLVTTSPTRADSVLAETPSEPPRALAERRRDERLANLPELFANDALAGARLFLDSPPAEALASALAEQAAPADGLFAEAVVGTSSGAPLGNVTAIATGSSHSCALLSNGTVRCWGHNRDGQLGNGTTTDFPAAAPVVGLGGMAAAIAAGEFHTCALLRDGTVHCWGDNWYGQLGDGTTTDRTTPVAASGLRDVTAIAAGEDHTCALLRDGTARCWGYNEFGQLGNGESEYATMPSPVCIATSTSLPVPRRP